MEFYSIFFIKSVYSQNFILGEVCLYLFYMLTTTITTNIDSHEKENNTSATALKNYR